MLCPKQKSNTIGVILPNIEHPYFAKVLKPLGARGCETGIPHHAFCFADIKKNVKNSALRCAKVKEWPALFSAVEALRLRSLKDLDFPLITLERSMDEGTSGIECDNYQGGVLATELLIEKGCRKLMFIGGVSAGVDIHMPGDLREVAFRDICKRSK